MSNNPFRRTTFEPSRGAHTRAGNPGQASSLPWSGPSATGSALLDDLLSNSGNWLKRAGGGEVSAGDVKGPGSSIGDKIPAFLSNGEFVVNAASASVNRPLLKAINDDPMYMTKYVQHLEQMVAGALTKVRATPRETAGRVDRSMTVRVSAFDVHEAFAKARLWEQRHAMSEV